MQYRTPAAADILIRGGTVVDGTGAEPFRAEVAITGGRISAVGAVAPGRGTRVIDADGMLVTPGFVDIHTHYDGQATWDPILAPSAWHGVTSVAMGNCGVGFAPARSDRHDWLIALLEGVEDIPGTALAEGLPWDWETFPEYLDSLERRPHALDLGVHIPHAALRTYVMGDRGADHAARPSDGELEQIALLVGEALYAGAVGFATSRTRIHRSRDGLNIGTLTAEARELLAVADVMRRANKGVVQLISDCYETPDEDFALREMSLIEEFARTSRRPLSFTVQQAEQTPDRWRTLLDQVETFNRAGLVVKAQIAPRPIGVLLGLTATTNPFIGCPSYKEVSGQPLDERVRSLRETARRQRILDEHGKVLERLPQGIAYQIAGAFDRFFRLESPVDYELDSSNSLAADAARRDVPPSALVYDSLLDHGGEQLLYLPLFNFANRSFEDLSEMVVAPNTLFGLSDAGAHCGAVCDASFPTSSLVIWGRDLRLKPALPVEWLVYANSARNAMHIGWSDRGVVSPGYLADINVIDFAALGCHAPELEYDLPAGGRRLVQRADGYRFTIKSGVVTFEDGEFTGELPGRLVRGERPAPGERR